MSELRRDPITNEWIIITGTRDGQTPVDFLTVRISEREGFCPFCEGNEIQTKPEIQAIRKKDSAPNTPGWSVRVIPSRYPICERPGEAEKKSEGQFISYEKMATYGEHEIIVESPYHIICISDDVMTQRVYMKEVLWIAQERIKELKKDPKICSVLVFKNQGYDRRISLPHAHSQIIGLPIIPAKIEKELNGARHYYEEKKSCIFCDILKEEMSNKSRIVEENDNFLAFVPFAARFPFETHIYPKQHNSDFCGLASQQIPSLAKMLKSIMIKIVKLLDVPPMEWVLHTAPFRAENGKELGPVSDYYHWHIEILPHSQPVRGLEWGGGCFINPPTPEVAAEFLRKIKSFVSE